MSSLLLQQAAFVGNCLTNATFQAWGQNVASRLNVCFANTGDGGQINWATVNTPASVRQTAGYECYKFTDALQTSAPIFFRVDYGLNITAGLATTNPGLYFTFGSGSDGAGKISGNTTANANGVGVDFSINGSSSSNTNVYSFFCGDTGRFAMALWWANNSVLGLNTAPFSTTSANPMMICFERTKDTSGNDTGDGLLIFGTRSQGGNPAETWQQVYWANSGAMGTSGFETSLGALTPQQSLNPWPIAFTPTNLILGADTPDQFGAFPIFFTKAGGVFSNPALNGVVVGLAHLYAAITTTSYSPMVGSVLKIPMYGSTHNYLVIPSIPFNIGRPGNTSHWGVAMRYE